VTGPSQGSSAPQGGDGTGGRSSAHDPSTLAALHPTQPRETRYRGALTSSRLSGSHLMTLRRPSRVPEYSRLYAPGDPVNLIDWQAYARTDQLLVREVRDEATARVAVVLDVSETMQWPTAGLPAPEPLPVAKAEVAARVALNLAHLHLRMGDLVELWLVHGASDARPSRRLAPRSPSDVVGLFERWLAAGFAPAGVAETFPEGSGVQSGKGAGLKGGARGPDSAFWVGDCLGTADWHGWLGTARRSVLVHVLSSLELDIRWIQDQSSYFDEGAGKKEYQGAVLRSRENYAKHLAGWRGKLAARQKKRGGEYVCVSDATAIAQFHQALSHFAATPLAGGR
jgi:hypothetical protein